MAPRLVVDLSKSLPEGAIVKNNSHSVLRTILEFLVLFIVIFFATQLLMKYVVSKDVVQGTSMQPTLENGERLYSVRVMQPKRNDIVVINAPDRPKSLYIKRVIGMPGDTVSAKNDKLYVNGKAIAEPYLNHNGPVNKGWIPPRLNSPTISTSKPYLQLSRQKYLLASISSWEIIGWFRMTVVTLDSLISPKFSQSSYGAIGR